MPGSKRKLALAVLTGCAVLAAAGFLLFRANQLSLGYVPLRTYMDDAAGLMGGTQVRLNGIPIGYLDAQKLTNSRIPNRKTEFDLKVKERYLSRIPEDSLVGLASDNLLGGQFIGIRRGSSPRHVRAGAELKSTVPQDMTLMMAQMSQQLDRLQDVFTRAEKLLTAVDTGKGALGKLVQDEQLQTGAGVNAELDKLIASVKHGHGTVTRLLYDDPLDRQLQSPLKRVDAIMHGVDDTSARLKELGKEVDAASGDFRALQKEIDAGQGSLAHLGQLRAHFDALSVKVDGVMDRLNSGQGTIGQFMVNRQLSESLAGTTREFQELAKGLKANPRKFVRFKVF